jgi:hypothetical protein
MSDHWSERDKKQSQECNILNQSMEFLSRPGSGYKVILN